MSVRMGQILVNSLYRDKLCVCVCVCLCLCAVSRLTVMKQGGKNYQRVNDVLDKLQTNFKKSRKEKVLNLEHQASDNSGPLLADV